MFSDYVYKWLDNALDYGLTESDFWNMTLAELTRAIDSKKRIQEREAREKASYDYILADLIGRSIGRLYSSSTKLPDISEVYPNIFDSNEIEEAKSAKVAELSAIRFKQFAKFHNDRFKEVADQNE